MTRQGSQQKTEVGETIIRQPNENKTDAKWEIQVLGRFTEIQLDDYYGVLSG